MINLRFFQVTGTSGMPYICSLDRAGAEGDPELSRGYGVSGGRADLDPWL